MNQDNNPEKSSSDQTIPGNVITPLAESDPLQSSTNSRGITPSYGIDQKQNGQHIKHSRVKRLALIIILLSSITSLVIIAALYMTRSNSKKSAPPVSPLSTKKTVVSINAKTKEDYANVCSGNIVSNAVGVGNAPRVIAVFEETVMNSREYLSAEAYVSDKTWLANDDAYQNIGIVGCLSHKSESFSGKSCSVKDVNGSILEKKLYSVDYSLKLIQAKNGVILGNYSIERNEVTCPANAYYTISSIKVFTAPNLSKFNQSIRPFINTN